MSRVNLKKAIYINIRGGLGNQLFCYFIGEFIKTNFHVQVNYIYNAKSNVHDKLNSKINSFNLGSDFINTKSLKFYLITIKLASRHILVRKKKPIEIDKTQNLKSHLLFDEIYDEEFLGFRKESEAIRNWLSRSKSKTYYLRGLFQDFNYFDNQPQKNLDLKNPSQWYIQFTNECRSANPIILHVRLGDYLKDDGGTIGVLSLEYYQSALDLLRTKYPYSQVWVFSNQTAKAKILLMPIVDKSFKFIYEAEDKDPAEVLLAMSMGNALITSNSTFSLWSAKMSNDLSSIVVPDPFFKSLPIYSQSFNISWAKLNSKWLTQEEISQLS
jgi:hypothetical protein